MMKSDRWGPIRIRKRDQFRSFEYHLPTRILYGTGRIAELGSVLEELRLVKPLIVTDKGVRATGIVDRVLRAVAEIERSVPVFDGVMSDPLTSTVEEVRDVLVRGGHDGVIGLGGGSALDVAKAAAALVTNEGSPKDYMGRDKLTSPSLPVVGVPTTAGTGSEVTMWSVLTDQESGSKVSIGSVLLMPRIALLDPTLTYGLPPALTASTGMDALCHAVESYASVWNHPIAEALALEAIELVGSNLRDAVRDGEDKEARGKMLLASLISELAANSTRLGLCHALAIPLGAQHHIPHGLANAMLLSTVVEFNTAAGLDRYAEIASRLDGGTDAASAIEELKRDVGLSENLAEWSLFEDDFANIAEVAMRSDNVQANPREARKKDLIDILRAAGTSA